MTPLSMPLDAGDTLSEAKARMHMLDVRHLPVLDGQRLIGVLSEGDIVATENLEARLVGAAMNRHPFTVRPDEAVGAVLRAMAYHDLDSVVVVQSYRLLGLLTAKDALRLLSHVIKCQHPSERLESHDDVVPYSTQRARPVWSAQERTAQGRGLSVATHVEAPTHRFVRSPESPNQFARRYDGLMHALTCLMRLQALARDATRAQLVREHDERTH